MRQYRLDPAHFYSAPGLSWVAMMKMTKAQPELLSDIDMHLFVEKGLRGGISTVCEKRYSEACGSTIEEGDGMKNHIMYLDANNLYGYAMCQKLPYSDFKWVDMTLEQCLETLEYPNPDIRHLYEVDLHYPAELHDSHNSYPLAPETKVISMSRYSPYQKNLVAKLNQNSKHVKLVTTLDDKLKYIVHEENLKLYLELGLDLKQAYRVLEFSHRAWLKPYIDFNTELRKRSTNDFEKNFFKLMNNSVFGKTMEKLRKRTKVHLVRPNDEVRMTKLISSPSYESHKIFENGLVAIHSKNTNLVLYK